MIDNYDLWDRDFSFHSFSYRMRVRLWDSDIKELDETFDHF